jgi:hypothetical protein
MISNLEHVSPLGKSDHCVLNVDFNCYANICTQPKTVKMHNNGKFMTICVIPFGIPVLPVDIRVIKIIHN